MRHDRRQRRGAGSGRRALAAWGLALGLASGCAPRPLAHFFYPDSPAARASLEQQGPRISLLSPPWFVVDEQGRLESSVDPAIVSWTAGRGLPLAPLVVNRGFRPETARPLLTAGPDRERLLKELLASVSAQGFFGLQLDLEGLAPQDRDAYVELARLLAGELHARQRKLGVAVPAPLAAEAPRTAPGAAARAPWARSDASRAFDYPRLAQVADFVSLMAYDQHTAPDHPGPVAGLPWVEACVEQGLAWVPRRKLLLGVPLYYRQWLGGVVSEGSYSEARELAERRRASIVMDPREREKTYSFREGGADGVVWLQDAATLRERIALVDKHKLAGFSAWKLGDEDPALWESLDARARRPD